MPPNYIGAIGELNLPRNEGKSIIKDMKKGILLTGSGGSLIEKYHHMVTCYYHTIKKSGYAAMDMSLAHHNYSRHYVLKIVAPLLSL